MHAAAAAAALLHQLIILCTRFEWYCSGNYADVLRMLDANIFVPSWILGNHHTHRIDKD